MRMRVYASAGLRGSVLAACVQLASIGCAEGADGGGAAEGPSPLASAPAQTGHVGQGQADNGDAVAPGAGALSEGALSEQRCAPNPQAVQRTDYAKSGTHQVAVLEATFEDPSRPILATSHHPAAPGRTLVTSIFYPASEPTPLFGSARVAEGGPFPMLMYSHGYSSARSEATRVAQRLASHGYIVVAPDFPLTSMLANGGSPDVNDAANQPGDVTFLIDKMLAASADVKHLLANAIDKERIGALGVSLGGLTTLLATYHPRFHDPRIKAAMPIAALSSFFTAEFYKTRSVPLLLVHGDNDAFIDYETNARRAFMRAGASARLITVARGSHAAFGAELDAALLPLLNALMAPADADPNNPDGLGCGAVAGTLSETGPEFMTAMGDAADFINYDEASPPPCQGDEYKKPAMNPAEQEEVVLRSAAAFFDAHLAKTPEARKGGCRYLVHEVPKMAGAKIEE
jgi:dienelactone hydrolase